jgi:hypothetical protein
MPLTEAPGLVAGAVALGAIHGIEPGHGWPVAATYALDRSNEWLAGLAASLVLGIGHLVSSIAVVLGFFLATDFLGVTQFGWLDYVAGGLLILLGGRELRGGGHHHGAGGADHSHDHDHSRNHEFVPDGDREHGSAAEAGLLARAKLALPFVGGHEHARGSMEDAADRGLWGIAGFAFLLGFAHEEEFEIIAICTGSSYCLELMLIYAVTVIAGIVGLTLALVAGYHTFEARVARLSEYFPLVSGAVLIGMGLGFLGGLF